MGDHDEAHALVAQPPGMYTEALAAPVRVFGGHAGMALGVMLVNVVAAWTVVAVAWLRAGRIGVSPDLTLPGHPDVFVVGDMIALDHLPGVAQVAIQGAKYAAKQIDDRLKGKPEEKPFKYFDKG